MKRRISAILLIISLILPAIATYSWLQHRKKAVRKEVKHKIIAGISKEELTFLAFSSQEITSKLKWKHSKEFEFNGEMYDIVSSETKGDSTYYWCWWDYEETALNQQLKKMASQAMNSDPMATSKQQNLLVFIRNLYFETNTLDLNISSVDTYSSHIFINKVYESRYIPPISPPPKSLV